MAVRTITTQLALDGEKEFKREMSEANSQLKTLRTETQKLEEEFRGQANTTEYLTRKSSLLRDEIAQQDEKVRALRGALEDAAAAYGETDKRTDAFRQQLNRAETDLIKMNRELKDTEKYLDEARKSADGTAGSIDGFGKEIGDAGNPLDEFKKSLGSVKDMLIGGAIVTGVKELAGAILEVEESTREYRAAMGTLEVAGQNAGYSIEQTYDVYRNLNGVMGDTQAAAEAATQLMNMGLNMENLNAVTDATIGMWVALGQAAPIESIAESVQQTIAAGTATGAFSDYLMAAGISEDEFNEKLGEAKTATERANMVLKLLSDEGLAQVGQDWKDVNEDIVKANESQEKVNEAMGRLGELVSPVADAIRNSFADAVDWLVEKVEAALPMLEGMAEMAEKVWNAITSGEELDVYTSGQYGSRSVDGSHAGGLNYVPFDGYRAELHEGERIQTREEADWWRSAQQPLPGMPQGVTAAQMQAITAAAVNATNLNRGREQIAIEAKWVVNGREFYADTIEDFRAVNRSNPEVTGDR